jgi:hypothetical protein
MRDPAEIRSLLIDIAFARLQEWLIDRKRVPHDWRKRLATLCTRITAAFASLRGTSTLTCSRSSSKVAPTPPPLPGSRSIYPSYKFRD